MTPSHNQPQRTGQSTEWGLLRLGSSAHSSAAVGAQSTASNGGEFFDDWREIRLPALHDYSKVTCRAVRAARPFSSQSQRRSHRLRRQPAGFLLPGLSAAAKFRCGGSRGLSAGGMALPTFAFHGAHHVCQDIIDASPVRAHVVAPFASNHAAKESGRVPRLRGAFPQVRGERHVVRV